MIFFSPKFWYFEADLQEYPNYYLYPSLAYKHTYPCLWKEFVWGGATPLLYDSLKINLNVYFWKTHLSYDHDATSNTADVHLDMPAYERAYSVTDCSLQTGRVRWDNHIFHVLMGLKLPIC